MGVKFGGCGTSRDAAARRMATTKNADRGDTCGDGTWGPRARRGIRLRSLILGTLSPSCRSGRRGVGPGTQEGLRTRGWCLTCRVPGSGAPLASLDGQVFWLTATIDARAAFPRRWRRSGRLPGPLADYSSGPAPDSHRLPSSSTRRGGRNPSIFPSIPDNSEADQTTRGDQGVRRGSRATGHRVVVKSRFPSDR
jgi:hypothetical protein